MVEINNNISMLLNEIYWKTAVVNKSRVPATVERLFLIFIRIIEVIDCMLSFNIMVTITIGTYGK